MINGSYRLNTVLGQNKASDESMISNALYALDTMQDSWSNEKLMVYSIKPYIFYTQPNQKVYTMGPATDNPGAILEYQLPPTNTGSGYVDGQYLNVNVLYNLNIIAGVVSSGTFVDGETITQAVSGATAIVSGTVPEAGPLNILTLSITGAPDSSDVWTGGTSGATFTPTDIPVAAGQGTLARANITVNLGQVIDIQVVNQGTGGFNGINYQYGDLLTVDPANLGGSGGGFVFTPASVTEQTNWIIPRPMKIEKAYTIWNSGSAQNVDIPISLLTMEQYASITVKDTTSTFSFGLYDDNSYPTRNITVFPIPQMTVGIRFWLREPLVVATRDMLDVQIDFPPGYERAFRFNLAVELAPEYMKTVPQEVTSIARDSKLAIARLNQAPRYKMGDGSLSRRGVAGRWNWITGNFFYGGWG